MQTNAIKNNKSRENTSLSIFARCRLQCLTLLKLNLLLTNSQGFNSYISNILFIKALILKKRREPNKCRPILVQSFLSYFSVLVVDSSLHLRQNFRVRGDSLIRIFFLNFLSLVRPFRYATNIRKQTNTRLILLTGQKS